MSLSISCKHEKGKHNNRDAYGDAMLELMAADNKVVHIDCDLMNCINVKRLQKEYPNQVFNAGIAEQNAVAIAAGLAASGLTVFVHSFGCFASRRAFDQAFLSIGYSERAVTIIGSDPGVTAEFNGATHMPFEDCALYMTIPDFIVIDSADYAQTYSFTKVLAGCKKPAYLRLIRKEYVQIYEEGTEFEIGRGYILKDGKDVTIIASGIETDEALKAYELLKKKGISSKVIDMPTWKPLDEKVILDAVKETGCLVTAENHQVSCGLGAQIARLLLLNNPVPQEFIGIQDRFGQVGPRDYLMKEYNLLSEDIAKAAEKVINRKMHSIVS